MMIVSNDSDKRIDHSITEIQTVLDIPKVYLLEEKKKHHIPLLGDTTDSDSLLRSQRMSLVQLYLPVDIAKESISALGSVSCFQFRNLNEDKSPNQLLYAGEIKQLEEAERRLCLLVVEAEAMGIWSPKDITLAEAESAAAIMIPASCQGSASLLKTPFSMGPGGYQHTAYSHQMSSMVVPNSLQELCDQLMDMEKKIVQLKSSEEELLLRRRELLTRSVVLAEAERLFFSPPKIEAEITEIGNDETPPQIQPPFEMEILGDNVLGFVGGLILRQKVTTLEGLLWRALRGHLLFHVSDLEEGEESVFLVSAHGETALAKVRRLALSLGASVISVCGDNNDTIQRQTESVMAVAGLEELDNVLASTASTKRAMLVTLTSSFSLWKAFIIKERAIFTCLNMCQLDAIDDSRIKSNVKNPRTYPDSINQRSPPTVQITPNVIEESSSSNTSSEKECIKADSSIENFSTPEIPLSHQNRDFSSFVTQVEPGSSLSIDPLANESVNTRNDSIPEQKSYTTSGSFGIKPISSFSKKTILNDNVPQGGCLVAEGWAPTTSLSQVRVALERARARTSAPISALCSEVLSVPLDGKYPSVDIHSDDQSHRSTHTKTLSGIQDLIPPTSFKLTLFTMPFQELINAYGIPSYGEINPGIFTLITFPFLFGVMFGDVGHGLLLFLAALFLVVKEKSLTRNPLMEGDLWTYFFGGRYIMLLMGLWSIYIGFIYNDCFSRAFSFFPSGWVYYPSLSDESSGGDTIFIPRQIGIPFFGIDSAWITAENALIFLNAYKTKQALLLGMLQMLFGLILSAFNYSFRGDTHSIIGLFLPQILFLSCTFGYLVLLFIAKWVIQDHDSPSLLLIFVDMFLSPGNVDPSRKFYPGQELVQTILLLVALLCIPWMLFYCPFARAYDNARKQKQSKFAFQAVVDPLVNDSNSIGAVGSKTNTPSMTNTSMAVTMDEQTEFSLSDELVHSGIHTIEFVLASISNTASYLRLWALSLAHSQLSEVLWSLIAENASSSPLMGVIIFTVWFSLTIAILVAMEGLSAFLHALRLHWVEFNNKFYQGEGYIFEPFSLTQILAPESLRSFSSTDID